MNLVERHIISLSHSQYVNGSYNILRKAIPNDFADGIEGFVVNPTISNIVN